MFPIRKGNACFIASSLLNCQNETIGVVSVKCEGGTAQFRIRLLSGSRTLVSYEERKPKDCDQSSKRTVVSSFRFIQNVYNMTIKHSCLNSWAPYWPSSSLLAAYFRRKSDAVTREF